MPDSLISGARSGRYEIRSKIGEGGMGEVYLALDTKLDRQVALKILPPELAAQHDRMRRFVQEAKAASALNHPSIITIYEVDESESGHFIATEFIDGTTLREREARHALTLSESLDVVIQIASALRAAHDAGILHRDIKPENIMVRRDGIIKVLDFGLAKLTEKLSAPSAVDSEAPTGMPAETDPGTVMGTVSYMSPEQARGLKVDTRSDIFSLGVVLYELVTGRLPFEGATAGEVIAAILNQEPVPIARYTLEAPAELQRMISKALRKDREERYQGIKDLHLDLKGLREELEFQAKQGRAYQRE